MSKKRTKRQAAIIRRRIFLTTCCAVLIAAISAICITVNLISKAVKSNKNETNSDIVYNDDKIKKEEPVHKIATATVINTGDILVHSPVLAGAKTSNGEYDFSAFFPQAKSYFTSADLAVANLEVTLGGTESGAYSGYPAFNTPDSVIDSVKDSGIGLLLTSNNHCYDTGLFGLKRTVQVLKSKGMPFIGTKETADDPSYLVKNINGIKIGMTCYTYENKCDTAGRKSINGAIISTDANNLINTFSYDHIDNFYSEAENTVKLMKQDGADCVVFYMHWGEEYQLTENTWQRTIAQKLCDFGVDVIVGGHPHVVQPISLLHASDSERTCVCLYSMGNSISNQRQEIMHPECTTGHTEDGVLFSYTFEKYSDGKIILSAVDIIPTWVDKYRGGSGYLYTMYPLESAQDGSSKYSLSSDSASRSQKSFERTKNIVASGLTECQNALGCDVRFKSE